METLSLIGNIASIISFIGSLFVLNKVISIKNNIGNNFNNVEQKNNTLTGNITGRDDNRS